MCLTIAWDQQSPEGSFAAQDEEMRKKSPFCCPLHYIKNIGGKKKNLEVPAHLDGGDLLLGVLGTEFPEFSDMVVKLYRF